MWLGDLVETSLPAFLFLEPKPDHYHGNSKFPKAELERFQVLVDAPLVAALFDYLKINPLCCSTVLLFSQSVGDDNLQDVFAEAHICAEP